MVLEGEVTCLRSQAGREGRGSQTPTSVDHYLGICGFLHRGAYVVVVYEEVCCSRVSPQAQQDQGTERFLRSGALEHVQYLAALTVSVWASS